MKKFFRTQFLLAAIVLAQTFSVALASPAQDLFNQATYYLSFRYFGYSDVSLDSLIEQYKPELETACQDQADTCPFEIAAPIVEKMILDLQDGHSAFLSSEARRDMARSRDGLGPSSPRIGIMTRSIDGETDRLVSDVVEGSPAERAGIKRGDRLVSLNGQVSGTFDNFQAAIVERAGSKQKFVLGIRRGTKELDISLSGGTLSARLPSLKILANNIGVLRIPAFDQMGVISARVHELVAQANRKKLHGLIIDLRDNPGGVAIEVLACLGAFTDNAGFTLQSRDGPTVQRWQDGGVSLGLSLGRMYPVISVPNPARWKGKMLVLVNSNSYSGAEYFSQLIQDAHRGQVMGEVTGGLGNTATTEFPLQDGSALLITIARSLRLDGTPLPERVTPDIEIADDLEQISVTGHDAVLERAQELLR